MSRRIHGDGSTTVTSADTTETVTISVTDEGCGWPIAPDGRRDTAPCRHGHGMPLARRLVEQLSGRLVIARHGHHPRIDVIVTPSNRALEP